MRLYHYYDRKIGPFVNLSDSCLKDAEDIMESIRNQNISFAAQRDATYLKRRFEYEEIVRNIFESKGGKIQRRRPHYMTLEECPWLLSWYSDGASISININEIDTSGISFTYGDMFPVFGPRGDDSVEYRKQVYTYNEILIITQKYGLPQSWNPVGEKGPIRYIEAQIWDHDLINKIINMSDHHIH